VLFFLLDPALYWRPASYPYQNLKSLRFAWTSSHQSAPGYDTAAHLLPLPLGDPSVSDSSTPPRPSTQTPIHLSIRLSTHPCIRPSTRPTTHRSAESPGQRRRRVPPPGSHPSSRSAACRFVLHNISEIWPSLPICTAKTLVKTLSISHLNYCKILLSAWQMQPHPALPTPSSCPATTVPANHSLKSFMLQRITHKHLLRVIFLAGDHSTAVKVQAPTWM